MLSVYAKNVYTHGLTGANRMTIERVPHGARVLDVGCSAGFLAAPLREQRGCRYVDGIELDPVDATVAGTVCRKVVVGSVEDPATLARLEGPYDAIVCGDVLEHLRDPGAVLRSFITLLADAGVVVASIPNVAHYTIRAGLLRGRFEYRIDGILDQTHLRFYTKAGQARLFREAGYRVVSCAPVLSLPEAMTRWLRRPLAERIGRRFDELFSLQFITVAQIARGDAAAPTPGA